MKRTHRLIRFNLVLYVQCDAINYQLKYAHSRTFREITSTRCQRANHLAPMVMRSHRVMEKKRLQSTQK